MRRDISNVASITTKYYRVEAVMKHEELHVERFSDDVLPAFRSLQSATEGLSFAPATHGGAQQALAALISSASAASTTFERAYKDSVRDEVNHAGGIGAYTQVELAEMSSHLPLISAKATQLGCP